MPKSDEPKVSHETFTPCPAKLHDELCALPAGHAEEHESESYVWDRLPPVPGRDDQAEPFGKK